MVQLVNVVAQHSKKVLSPNLVAKMPSKRKRKHLDKKRQNYSPTPNAGNIVLPKK
jgi:hypothetical protein